MKKIKIIWKKRNCLKKMRLYEKNEKNWNYLKKKKLFEKNEIIRKTNLLQLAAPGHLLLQLTPRGRKVAAHIPELLRQRRLGPRLLVHLAARLLHRRAQLLLHLAEPAHLTLHLRQLRQQTGVLRPQTVVLGRGVAEAARRLVQLAAQLLQLRLQLSGQSFHIRLLIKSKA